MLVVLACSSIGVYGIVLAGWASGSTYPLLGGLRSAAQMISLRGRDGAVDRRGLPVLPARCRPRRSSPRRPTATSCPSSAGTSPARAGTRSCCRLASSSTSIAVVGETNRAPFDLPEAESELVGGFHTEYSSLKFALFFLAEYINMVTVSALATTLFLGGWRAPWPISLWDGANTGWWPMLWFFVKVVVALFVFIWLRGTLPRLRYDQFMRFGWKVLIPINLVWILVVATMRTVPRGDSQRRGRAHVGIQRRCVLVGC